MFGRSPLPEFDDGIASNAALEEAYKSGHRPLRRSVDDAANVMWECECGLGQLSVDAVFCHGVGWVLDQAVIDGKLSDEARDVVAELLHVWHGMLEELYVAANAVVT